MSDLYIADTSCLIILSKINRLDVLKSLFREIHITAIVSTEFGEDLPSWVLIDEVFDHKKQVILELEKVKRVRLL